jgi:hypothetical protein
VRTSQEIQFDWVDALLVIAIGALAIVALSLLFPTIWNWCWNLVDVRNWPFWIWTCLGLVALGVLVWLRSRYE